MPAPEQNAPFFVDLEVITLSKNGVWLSDGNEIDHQQTVRLFAKSLKKDAAGYFLQVGRETKRIQVEDTAYFILRIEQVAKGSLHEIEISLNDASHEKLDPATLSYRPGRLTCRVKDGKEEAKFLLSAYFDLLKDLREDEDCYYLDFDGKHIELAKK